MNPPTGVSVPPFDEIWSEVSDPARDISRSTSWMSKNSPIGCLLMVVMAVGLCLIIVGWLAIDDLAIALPALAVGLAAVGIPMAAGLRGLKRANQLHTSGVLGPIFTHIAQQMSATSAGGSTATLEVQYDPSGSIPSALLRSSGFIDNTRVPQRNLFHGRFGSTDFAMVEVKWEAAELPDQSALVDQTGSLLHFTADFHKFFTSRTHLFPKDNRRGALRELSDEAARSKGLEPLRLEDPTIERLFTCWTDDQLEARYLITPELMVALTDLVQALDSRAIAVSFTDDRLHLAVVSTTTIFGLDVNSPDARAAARRVYDNLVLFLSLTEHFDLNTRIWSKA